MKIPRFELILLFFFVLVFYRFFFASNPFVAHDWPLLFSQSRDFHPFWVIAWDYMGAGGIGASALKTMWIDLYANFIYFISNLTNIPWWLSQRIFWLIPFILISIISSYKFSGLFIRGSISKTLAAIIYSFNTYILLIVGGGQFGIAFSYALSPLVLYSLIKLFEQTPQGTALQNQKLLTSGLISGLLIAFDPRISILVFGVFALWYLLIVRDFSFKKLKYVFLNFLIAGLLNSYWIIPSLFSIINSGINSSVTNYFSLPGVKFLSFATFENSISFLHPNWPENIFGKIYFQRPEFLLLPILAFSGMLLLKNSSKALQAGLTIEQFNNRTILFFVVLGLLGAFLAKGANEPFGQFYLFLFQNVPGFNLFRDPTKFYILIALSYSILIPYSIFNITESLKLKIKNQKSKIQSKYQIFNFSYVFLIFTILYLLFLLRPAWSGQLTGIFKQSSVPVEYLELENVLKEDKTFSRALWIPRRQKYGFFNPNHPAADSEILFAKKDISDISEKELSDLSIKYVIVPYDVESEIFLKDRKYDEKSYSKTIQRVEKLGLSEVIGFGKIKIYQTEENRDHFWCDCEAQIDYDFVNPAEYVVNIENAKKGDVLVFSEGFDKNWLAANLASQGLTLQAQKFGNNLNSFVLPKDGDYDLKVSYKVQEWVNIGLVISMLTLIGLTFATFLIYFRHGRADSRAVGRIRT